MFSESIRKHVLPIVESYPKFRLDAKNLHVGAMGVCYHSMVASEPLLKLAARLPGKHRQYFIEHEREERGHEEWMKKDIHALGGTIGYPQECIITMCGELYYKVRHLGPEHLLGYMAVIEGFPNPPEVIERLKKIYSEGSHCLAYHAANDVAHFRDLNEQLELVNRDMYPAVTRTAIRTATLYGKALWNMVFQQGVGQ